MYIRVPPPGEENSQSTLIGGSRRMSKMSTTFKDVPNEGKKSKKDLLRPWRRLIGNKYTCLFLVRPWLITLYYKIFWSSEELPVKDMDNLKNKRVIWPPKIAKFDFWHFFQCKKTPIFSTFENDENRKKKFKKFGFFGEKKCKNLITILIYK